MDTRLTLLDPFTSKGVFGYGWGAKNFGKGTEIHDLEKNLEVKFILVLPNVIKLISHMTLIIGSGADITEDYINRDDPVPTTNEPLPLAYTFDVTNSIARNKFTPQGGDTMHSWPIEIGRAHV